MSKSGRSQFEEISSLLTALITIVTLLIIILTLGESFAVFSDFSSYTLALISLIAGLATVSATLISRYYISRKQYLQKEKAELRVKELRERIIDNRAQLKALEDEFTSVLELIQEGVEESKKKELAKRADDIKDRYEATQMQYHFLVFSFIYISEFSGEKMERNLEDITNLVEDYQKVTSLFDDIEYEVMAKKEDGIDPSVQDAIEKAEDEEELTSLSEIASYKLDEVTHLPL